jgi:Phospholipase_D-nuclease N-terminal
MSPVVWAAVGLALLVVWGFTVVDLLRRELGAQRTAAWLLLILILPFVGAALYWVLRRPTTEQA